MRTLIQILLVAFFLAGAASCSPLRPPRPRVSPPLPPVVGVAPVAKPGPPPHAPAWGVRKKTPFRYYPAREVYFDPARDLYFWLEGHAWISGPLLPVPLRPNLGAFVSIELDGDHPGPFHAGIKGKYPPGQAKKVVRGAKPPPPQKKTFASGRGKGRK